MFKIPEEFRDIPEAIRLREAEAQFEAVVEQEKRATQQSGERVHLIGTKLARRAFQFMSHWFCDIISFGGRALSAPVAELGRSASSRV